MSGKTETRGKIKPRPAQHRAICLVCNHPQKEDIERRYLAFETCEKLAAEFGLSDDSISRHGRYFGLDERRVGDTEKDLRGINCNGLKEVKTVPPRFLGGMDQEVHRNPRTHK